jgi:two-component system, sensor histidine kinase and response regulator
MTPRAEKLFEDHRQAIYRRTDRMFALLLLVQYVAGIFAAYFISPRTWVGDQSALHLHVWAAVFLGAAIVSLPMALAWRMPGHVLTRLVIAVAQMLDSALLIHLSGGRIETHFHVFGSLAFLGFYRDWKVLTTASLVVAADHYLRGIYWPESVYGILTPASWRWLEHTGWVIFEDLFIFRATAQSLQEMREMAQVRADLERVADERADDIAHLKTVEAQLKEAVEVRDTFLSVCGHELKTPLASLKLSSQVAQRSLQKEGVIRARRFIEQTGVQADRLIKLVEDMLDATKIRAKRFSIEREQVELGELVETVIERCAPLAESAGCHVLFSSKRPVHGSWDRFRVEQVVLNLLTNAIKYGPSGTIFVEAAERNGIARISVRDHGKGIAPENQSRIFERFERIDKEGTVQGLGLGLFISKTIVEQHGGRLTVESALGEGSTFNIELPLASARAHALS